MDEYIKTFSDGNGLFYQKIKISDNIETEQETGYLYCKNSVLGHIGVQAYNGYEVGLSDKKVVYIRREPQDVFDEDSLASIEGKPVTLNHPDEMVTSKNFKKYVVGFVKNVRRDGDNILGDLVVNDMDTIEKITSGELKDLSMGYQAKLEPTADGELKQTNIVVNHVAVVKEGRAMNARIVDSKPEGSEDMKLDLSFQGVKDSLDTLQTQINDALHITKRNYESNETTVYDDETGKETRVEQTQSIVTHEHVEVKPTLDNANLLVSVTEENEGETKTMKDFNYFIGELEKVKAMPKSEFRDKAFEALNADCLETLKVELPKIVEEPKVSVLDHSVGLADNLGQTQEKKDEPKPLVYYAQDEERYFDRLYRSMDNKENAKKYASMTYNDVIDMLEGRNK